MAYDSARGRVVLFGGRGENAVFHNDTWEWDGVTWDPRSTSGPSARYGHSLAYDSTRHVTVLYGGQGIDGQTWEWDGNNWAPQPVAGPNPPRDGGALAYDSLRRRVVLFGGWSGSAYLGDTWDWDGGTWRLRASSGPTARTGHAMAYDNLRGHVVLFGGFGGGYLGDTWELTGCERAITQWRSVRTHGAAENRWIMLDHSAGETTVEPRQGGVQKIEVEFDRPVTVFNDASIVVTGPGSPAFNASTAGNTLILDFPGGLEDPSCYTIRIGAGAVARSIIGDNDCAVRVLVGDTTGDGVVNLSDALAVKARLGAGVADQPQFDVDLSGVIDMTDALAVKARITSPAREAACP